MTAPPPILTELLGAAAADDEPAALDLVAVAVAMAGGEGHQSDRVKPALLVFLLGLSSIVVSLFVASVFVSSSPPVCFAGCWGD